MKTKKIIKLQALVKAFEKDVLFNPDKEHLQVQSVFIDHKNKERRAIIITSEESDVDATNTIVKEYFKDNLYKIIKREEYPKVTVSIKTGKGIKHEDSQGWGTLGGFFKRINDSSLYGLSNAHVIANANNTSRGDNCIYSSNIIAGELFNWFTLNPPPAINIMDAALFRVDPTLRPIWVPNKPSKSLVGPKVNLNVYKYGKTTDFTEGKIKSYNGSAKVILNGKLYYFSGIMAIRSASGHFNKPGDSGSIVLTLGHHMVGLVFAKQNQYCWALPISRIGRLLK